MSDPATKLVHALVRYEEPEPHSIQWVEVRRLPPEEWQSVAEALAVVDSVVRSYDRFLTTAWADLEKAHQYVLDQAVVSRHLVLDALGVLEYRLLGFSTAIRLYETYITAEANRARDGSVSAAIRSIFSERYDASQAYRVIYHLRNAFQHGVRDLVGGTVSARLVEASSTETVESQVHVILRREVFARSGANAAVRKEVREMDADPDIVAMCVEAYSGIQDLHERVIPILHRDGPIAARTLMAYVREVGNENPHFHQYDEARPLESTRIRELDSKGFRYVIAVEGYELQP